MLNEEYGNRRLPIVIGMFEAQAIAIEIEKIVPNRPMTHDLFKQLGDLFKFTVREVVISDLKEGIFFAQIVCFDGVRESIVDARPSDAIAIGIRFSAPIYTTEAVLSEAGIVMTQEDDDEPSEEVAETVSQSSPRPFNEQLKFSSAEDLQRMLDEALANEEYERAAKIRDELSKRN